MAIELNKRTKILAGVVLLLVAGAAGAWFFLFQDDAPPPRTVVVVPAAPAPDVAKADAPKPAADAPKQADAGAAPAAPVAAKPAAPAAAKPAPGSPEQLIAEIIDVSGIKTQYQAIGRETLLKAIAGEQDKGVGTSAADAAAVSAMVDRAFDPAKLSADIAANLKVNFDAERMARFLELLRQPNAVKMVSPEKRNATRTAMVEHAENSRSSPPAAGRMKLIQSLDEVTQTSETATELTTAIVRNVVDTVLAEMQKAGKNVPKEARQSVGSQLNSMRAQMRGQIRSILYVSYKDASDQEITDYIKLLDADTGRWGMEQLSNAARPVLAGIGAGLGKEAGQLAMAKRTGAVAKTPAEPAAEPLAKAQTQAAAPAPVEAAAPMPKQAEAAPEPVGYRRAANVRELYSRYNDVISATVMRDQAAVKQLLDDGKSPNVRQSDGMTPLMIATSFGDVAIASMLLAKGADPNLRASGGTSALSLARSRGTYGGELEQLLRRNGAKD